MQQARQPFARRIVIAFVLMTVLVSGVFSLSIVAVVHFVEQRLVSDELRRELYSVVHEDVARGRSPRLDSDTRFYASQLPGYAIPQAYLGVEDGFTEVEEGPQAYYVYSQQVDGQRYLLVQAQDDFEAREQLLFQVVFAGFCCAVLGAGVLGWAMARSVMAPLSRLARQVRHRDQLHSLAPQLAPEYADDEVGQLAAAFDETLGRLRQSLERERLFTSDVSHELRTPLMVIASSCELLEQAPLAERQQQQLQRVKRACEEMRDLVQIFLQLARGQSKAGDFAATASLAQVAEQQCSRWGVLFREKGLVFECVSEGADDGAYNPTLLGTVIANLLRNALHYTEQGQARLVLKSGGLRVEDSGVGIPIEQQSLVFEPFVRGTRARGEGLGLGLSLVKRICLHQGWRIELSDLPGGGSCFSVQLGRGA